LPDNAESIRTAVRRMLAEPQLARRCSDQAKEDADARYTPKAVAEQHLKVYRELLVQHPSKNPTLNP
jgi:glycosyltransferase involved in cell wall biosynthesis